MDLFATKFFEATLEPRFRKFLVDLGSNSVNYPTTGNWNNISAANNADVSGYSVTNMIDSDGQSSPISVNIISGFTCSMDSAYTTTVNTGLYPWSALRDSFMAANGVTGVIIIAGVSANKQYKLLALSGRHSLTATTRMIVTVDIEGTEVAILDQQIATKNNITNLFETKDFTVPGIDKIRITVTGVASASWLNVIELREYI